MVYSGSMESDPGHIRITPTLRIPASELTETFSRSGGKGGQNVNKVETRVELRFDVAGSPSLSEWQRRRLMVRLANRLDGEGVLRITASEERTQLGNRRRAEARFRTLLREALQPVKKRRPTRPTAASQRRRVESKKVHAKKKRARRWRPED